LYDPVTGLPITSLTCPVTVTYSTADGTGPAAATLADNDYVSANTTLNFPAGVSSQSFNLLVNGDTKFEQNETFFVNITAGGAIIQAGNGQATVTINNDDSRPTIAISDVSALEGLAGTTAFNFIVTLSNLSYESHSSITRPPTARRRPHRITRRSRPRL
jgi:hypothetical protein